MRSLFLVLLATLIPWTARGDEPAAQTRLMTNLVEILQYVDAFSRTLDIDVPTPLTTNEVTQFMPYRGHGHIAGVRIADRFQFAFDVRYHFIDTFTDHRYAMHVLWRAEDIKPLIQPSKITQKQALEMARGCLVKLGYPEKQRPPLLPPEVHQWTWDPPGAPKPEPLPFFTIEWKWKKNPDFTYCRVEIDGFRQKITQFYKCPPEDVPPPGPPPQPKE